MFEQKTVTQLHPRLNNPMGLSVNHIDLATLVLTFHYQELVQVDGVWLVELKEQELVRGEHYAVDKRRGIIKLLDHPFWHTEGYWTVVPYERKGKVIDRKEELLYKGRVKHSRGQFVEATYEHWKPEEVVLQQDEQPETHELGVEAKVRALRRATGKVSSIDLNEIDAEAKKRLGYDLPRFAEAADPTPEERGKKGPSFDWE